MKLDEIEKRCSELKGKPLRGIVRTIDLIQMAFGDLIERENLYGNKIKIGVLALHFTCPFRLISKNEILISSNDLYIPIDDRKQIVDLDKSNSSIFDVKSKDLLKQYSNEYVEDVIVSPWGDLIINFTHLTLHLFNISIYENDESWRYFKLDEDNHLVMRGNSIDQG